VSRHVCIIHFTSPILEDRVVDNLRKAAEEMGGSAFFLRGKTQLDLDSTSLRSLMSQFPPHEYVGEVRWGIEATGRRLLGRLTYPIQPPIAMPGTLEFEFVWSSPAQKVFFDSVDLLLKFLRPIAASVGADNLMIEPNKLPADIHDVRYERFKVSKDDKRLSSVDWVVGCRAADYPALLSALEAHGFSSIEGNGFVICAFAENPLDYSRPGDRELLKRIENAFGI